MDGGTYAPTQEVDNWEERSTTFSTGRSTEVCVRVPVCGEKKAEGTEVEIAMLVVAEELGVVMELVSPETEEWRGR